MENKTENLNQAWSWFFSMFLGIGPIGGFTYAFTFDKLLCAIFIFIWCIICSAGAIYEDAKFTERKKMEGSKCIQ